MYPVKDNDNKFLYSKGFKWIAVQEVVQSVLSAVTGKTKEEIFGVKLKNDKHPVVDNAKMAVVIKVFDTLFPQPVLDQIAGSTGKVAVNRESLGQALANRILPVKSISKPDTKL